MSEYVSWPPNGIILVETGEKIIKISWEKLLELT